MTATADKTAAPASQTARILAEGFGPGAWHGPDMKAALEDVSNELAFRRPGKERHNIAEIALHHAYYVHSVRGRLASPTPENFPLPGDDWFVLDPTSGFSWDDVRHVLDVQYARLATLLDELGAGKSTPLLKDDAALEVILGITCHSAYHAGQIQLIKVLAG
jgi:DinB superfamily